MRLHPGGAAEYRRRHDAIWPDLVALLREAGVLDYRIYLDEETGHLFAVLTRAPTHTLDDLPCHPLMQRWWAMMADIVETHPDHAPVQQPLVEVFRL